MVYCWTHYWDIWQFNGVPYWNFTGQNMTILGISHANIGKASGNSTGWGWPFFVNPNIENTWLMVKFLLNIFLMVNYTIGYVTKNMTTVIYYLMTGYDMKLWLMGWLAWIPLRGHNMIYHRNIGIYWLMGICTEKKCKHFIWLKIVETPNPSHHSSDVTNDVITIHPNISQEYTYIHTYTVYIYMGMEWATRIWIHTYIHIYMGMEWATRIWSGDIRWYEYSMGWYIICIIEWYWWYSWALRVMSSDIRWHKLWKPLGIIWVKAYRPWLLYSSMAIDSPTINGGVHEIDWAQHITTYNCVGFSIAMFDELTVAINWNCWLYPGNSQHATDRYFYS